MKKSIAYILIILGIITLICTDIIVAHKFEDLKISQEMYESLKGLKVIISAIEARITANELKSISRLIFVFLFGSGIVILLLEKVRMLQNRIEKLGHKMDKKP